MSVIGLQTPARPGLGLQPVVFLIRNFERHVGRAALDLGDAAGAVGHEFEDDGLERRLRPPIFVVALQPQERVALIFVDHVGAGADRLLLEALRADLGVIGLRQHIAGEERHPLEDGRIEILDVGRDAIAFDLEIAERGPDEGDGVAALRVAGALDRPDDVLGRQRRAVVPDTPSRTSIQALVLSSFQPHLVSRPGSKREIDVSGRYIDRRPSGRSPGWLG